VHFCSRKIISQRLNGEILLHFPTILVLFAAQLEKKRERAMENHPEQTLTRPIFIHRKYN
jgi:hypothetical protein